MLVAASLLLFAAFGCGKEAGEEAPAVSVTVQVAHPRRGAISQHIVADAVLSPLAQAALSPRISAPVHRFYVQRGSAVKAGQLLATLEDRDLRAAVVDTQGSYTAAQAALRNTTGAQVPEETERSRLDVAQAQATRDLDASIVRDRQKLFEQGAIAGRELDTAHATLVQAQATLDVAQQHLSSLDAVQPQSHPRAIRGRDAERQGQIPWRRGAGLLCRSTQPHCRRSDRPALVRRGDAGRRHAADHHHGYLRAAGQDAPRAGCGSAAESRRCRQYHPTRGSGAGSCARLPRQPCARSWQHHPRGVAAD